MKVGVLALQGAVEPHERALAECGATAVAIRNPAELDEVDGLILPGGESTTMSMLLDRAGLFDPLAERLRNGMPALGTCAGMILLAREILDGRPDQRPLQMIDLTVARNGYGRQRESFETEIALTGAEPLPAVFIRAPIVTAVGSRVEVLASFEGRAVWCRQGAVTVTAFHPELSADRRVHELFLQHRS